MVLVLLLTIGVSFINKPKEIKQEIVNTPEPKVEKQTPLDIETPEQSKPRVWNGAEYKLPIGVVIDGEMDDNDPSINWLSIQQPDGHMVLVTGIDGKLWSAIEIGDIIE